MDFALTEDQQMLADSVADFVGGESDVTRARRMRGHADGFERDMWRQLAELGWLAVPFPEEAGGYGWGFLEVALIAERLGRTLVPEPFLASAVLAGTALCEAASPAQRDRWLAPLIAGESVVALAHDASTRAEADGDGWRLWGSARWVLAGHAADVLVVSAGDHLFVVDPGASGVHVRRLNTIDGHGAAHITFEGAPAQARLAGDASSALELAFDRAAAGAVAEGVGVAQRMHELTLQHLGEREQFGKPIGAFQALKHRAVDMFVEVNVLKASAIDAHVHVDDPDPVERRKAVSAAKVQLASSGLYIARQAVQLHGGVGVTDEHDIGLYFKRMHALCALFGDADHHVRRFADQRGFFPEPH